MLLGQLNKNIETINVVFLSNLDNHTKIEIFLARASDLGVLIDFSNLMQRVRKVWNIV
jgi:hypothetical protein